MTQRTTPSTVQCPHDGLWHILASSWISCGGSPTLLATSEYSLPTACDDWRGPALWTGAHTVNHQVPHPGRAPTCLACLGVAGA